ncbi:hypothetical protein CALVIDRAFT_29760 [Calocera viscosa TUFC12733]|uniref:Uncharacterized protein n=1 Tax=Calocera viscosa (strain TUFC12733) TaxID=1330018 RepID=A0A167PBC2_CALVF|nr:hypothetical protein CALVIDRAFT_29760 [Calocera viscosa TUFC12733]
MLIKSSYHQLELDPATAPQPEPPILLPSGKPQPQTVDELFQSLLGPSTSTASSSPAPSTGPASAPAPAPGPPTRQQGRRRGESVSGKDSDPPAKQILTASTGPGGREQKEGKGKKPRRPKSVPPQQQAEEPPLAQDQQQQNGHGHGLPTRPGIADFAAQASDGAATPVPVLQDPTLSLKQIFGLLPGPAPAAPTPPASALLSQSQGSAAGPSAALPAQGKEGKNGHARKKSAHLPTTIQTPNQNQYIPQPTLNSESLVDARAVKGALVERLVRKEQEEGEGRECITQREFVQEVLRLIHTDKEWTKGLWEEYVRRKGEGEVGAG